MARRASRSFKKKPCRFFQAAAGIEQKIVFAGKFNVHAEIAGGFEMVGTISA